MNTVERLFHSAAGLAGLHTRYNGSIQERTMNDAIGTESALRAELNAARATIARLEAGLVNRLPQIPTLTAAFAETLANSLPYILYLFDSRATLLWWNQHFERATGYRAEELAGAHISSFVPAESLPLVNQRFQAVL